MTNRESWQCPCCGCFATVITSIQGDSDRRSNKLLLVGDRYVLEVASVVCPNSDCERLVLSAKLHHAPDVPDVPDEYREVSYSLFSLQDYPIIETKSSGKTIQEWQLLPESCAKPFPTYIPESIRKDYAEACRIRDLSPNAAATLARRCLQGMVRDFHNIERSSLKQEFEEIKEKVTEVAWHGIEAVREYGAIGAHMEEDVNVMVDVEVEEADQLIKLIELLLEEWYVARHENAKRWEKVKGLGANKKKQDAKARAASKNRGDDDE